MCAWRVPQDRVVSFLRLSRRRLNRRWEHFEVTNPLSVKCRLHQREVSWRGRLLLNMRNRFAPSWRTHEKHLKLHFNNYIQTLHNNISFNETVTYADKDVQWHCRFWLHRFKRQGYITLQLMVAIFRDPFVTAVVMPTTVNATIKLLRRNWACGQKYRS